MYVYTMHRKPQSQSLGTDKKRIGRKVANEVFFAIVYYAAPARQCCHHRLWKPLMEAYSRGRTELIRLAPVVQNQRSGDYVFGKPSHDEIRPKTTATQKTLYCC